MRPSGRQVSAAAADPVRLEEERRPREVLRVHVRRLARDADRAHGLPRERQLDALRPHPRAVHVQEEVEVEVDEVGVLVEEVRRAQLEPPVRERLVDPGLAADGALRLQRRVAAERGRARQREEARQLRRAPGRHVQAGGAPARPPDDPRVRVQLHGVAGGGVDAESDVVEDAPALLAQRPEDAAARPRVVVVAAHLAAELRRELQDAAVAAPLALAGDAHVHGRVGGAREGKLPGEPQPRERRVLGRLRDERGHRRARAVQAPPRQADEDLLSPVGVAAERQPPREREVVVVRVARLAGPVHGPARAVRVVVLGSGGEPGGEAERRVRGEREVRGGEAVELAEAVLRDAVLLLVEGAARRPAAFAERSRDAREAAAQVGVAGLGAGNRAHRSRSPARGEELHDAGEAVRTVEGGEGPAHDLGAVDEHRPAAPRG